MQPNRFITMPESHKFSQFKHGYVPGAPGRFDRWLYRPGLQLGRGRRRSLVPGPGASHGDRSSTGTVTNAEIYLAVA